MKELMVPRLWLAITSVCGFTGTFVEVIYSD